MKKLLVIVLVEVLILSGCSLYETVSSGKNDIINSSDTTFLDDKCQCNLIVEIDEDDENSGYLVMKKPMYIDSSDIFNSLKPGIINTPDEFSWKYFEGKDWTTPAKHQGNCGSCWDFAAIGAFESVIEIREECAELCPDLSEQYVLSCLPAAANNYGQGCWGGTPYGAFYYMMDTTIEGNYQNGAIPETCLPYQASDDIPCSEKCDNWEELLVPILDCEESYLGFDSPENREIIKSQIYQYGPIAAGMNVTTEFINFWSVHHDPTDYFPDTNEPWGNSLNHIIVILGWKNDSSIDNGGYWICKNSWGTDWGYSGFYNIEYGSLFTGFYISTVDYDPDSFDWPPIAPMINGPITGKPGEEYEYTFASKDPDGDDDVYYYVDWGDNTNSDWLGPFMSGEEVMLNHTWEKKGNYNIRAKAKDINDAEGDWGTLEVTMPRNRAINTQLQQFKQNFILNHPNLLPILQRFLISLVLQ